MESAWWILVHNTSNGAFLGWDYSTNSTNINIGALMIINSSDINISSGFEDDAYVVTCYYTISTSINE
jgi:hypothetical protein